MQLSQELVDEVKAGFVRQRTSLNAFCLKNGIDSGNVYRYLRGELNSSKAQAARDLVIAASLGKPRD